MTRENFSKATIGLAIKRATAPNGVIYCEGEGCGLPCKKFEIHHRLSCRQGGKPTLENAQLLCIPCHDKETALQAPVHAKLRRVEAKHVGAVKPKGQIKSAPLPSGKREPTIKKEPINHMMTAIERRFGVTR